MKKSLGILIVVVFLGLSNLANACNPFTPSISASGNTTCQGDSIYLNAGFYSSYIWSSGETTANISVNSSNTYYVIVTNSNGCTGTASIIITVIPTTHVTSSFIADSLYGCIPLTVHFTNLSINGNSYLWNFGDNTTATTANPTHVYTDTGNFTVTLIAINNSSVCGTVIDTFSIIIIVHACNNSNIETIFKPDISLILFPNPATTILKIHKNSQLSIFNSQLIITDLLGTEVYKEKSIGIDNTISISTWSAGIYFYEIRSDTAIIRGKFVKE